MTINNHLFIYLMQTNVYFFIMTNVLDTEFVTWEYQLCQLKSTDI